jgi:hypothetical protein
LASPITKVDTVGVPSQNTKRSREFYVDTLGLRPDEHAWNEFWVGETFDTGVCRMANFTDPDGNQLTLHKRYAPYREGSAE